MAHTVNTQVYALAREIARMVRHEGRHDFTFTAGGSSAATLCGLSVETDHGALLRIVAADMELSFEACAPANDHATSSPAICRFRKGSLAELKSWHGRLGGLHAFFVPRAA